MISVLCPQFWYSSSSSSQPVVKAFPWYMPRPVVIRWENVELPAASKYWPSNVWQRFDSFWSKQSRTFGVGSVKVLHDPYRKLKIKFVCRTSLQSIILLALKCFDEVFQKKLNIKKPDLQNCHRKSKIRPLVLLHKSAKLMIDHQTQMSIPRRYFLQNEWNHGWFKSCLPSKSTIIGACPLESTRAAPIDVEDVVVGAVEVTLLVMDVVVVSDELFSQNMLSQGHPPTQLA